MSTATEFLYFPDTRRNVVKPQDISIIASEALRTGINCSYQLLTSWGPETRSWCPHLSSGDTSAKPRGEAVRTGSHRQPERLAVDLEVVFIISDQLLPFHF